MKKIKIPKDFYKKLDSKISFPTFECKVCGREALDVPINSHLKDKDTHNEDIESLKK